MAENGVKNGGYAYQKGDAAAISALASGKTVKEAAEASLLSERTITRRLILQLYLAEWVTTSCGQIP